MSRVTTRDENRPHPDVVICTQRVIEVLTCLPGGRRLVTGSDDGTVRVWNIENGEQEGALMPHERRISHLAVTRCGTKIVSADDDGRVKVWDVESHQLLSGWTCRNLYPRMNISPNGRVIAVGKMTVEIYTMDGKIVNSIGNGGLTDSLCFAPDGRKLACGAFPDISVYDVRTGARVLGPLKGHQNAIWNVLWSDDGSRLFSASLDKTIRCWNSQTGEQVNAWSGHAGWIVSLSLSEDGSTLATASLDKTIRFWNATTGDPVGKCLQHTHPVHSVVFAPSSSGEFVASVAVQDAKIFLWRVAWLDSVKCQVYPAQSCTQTPVLSLPPCPSLAHVPSAEEAPGPSHYSTSSDQPIATSPLDTYRPLQLKRVVQLRGPTGNFSVDISPPLDLTSYVVKKNDSYIAGGGFGDVYRCWYHDGVLHKEVAVKAFRFRIVIDGTMGDGSPKMLRRELGIWRRLDHRNIVPFLGIAYGFGMHGAMSLVSLWMPNESLHDFLTQYDDNLGIGHRLQLLLNVANGLHYLHSVPIVHGDLNSNNVLLDADYTARLADFGYASLIGTIPEALSYLQRSTARPGALRWVAPEQVKSEDMFQRTTKSDIYSFGCVALQESSPVAIVGLLVITLQVLSGKQPWSEVREDVAVILRLANGHKPGRPESRLIDDSHWNLVQRCWSSIEERPSAEVVISEAQQFLNNCPLPQPLQDSAISCNQVTAEGARSDSYVRDKDNHKRPYDIASESTLRHGSAYQHHLQPLTLSEAFSELSPDMPGVPPTAYDAYTTPRPIKKRHT